MTAARYWRLPFDAMSWRGSSGDLSGQQSGNSIDFHDHRLYQLGDDPRHINWNAYARTGQHSLKQFRQEVQPVLQLLVDVSASMWLDVAKARRSAEMIYLCCHAGQQVHAQVRVYFWNGDEIALVPVADILQHGWYDRVQADCVRGGKVLTPDMLARWLPLGGGLQVWISDLLFAGDPGSWLQHFCPLGQLGLIFAPFAAAESKPTWQGAIVATDVDTGQELVSQWDELARLRYERRYQMHFTQWQDHCQQRGLRLCRLPAELPLNAALLEQARLSGAMQMQ